MRLSRRDLLTRNSRTVYRTRIMKWMLSVGFISLMTIFAAIYQMLTRSYADSSFQHRLSGNEWSMKPNEVVQVPLPDEGSKPNMSTISGANVSEEVSSFDAAMASTGAANSFAADKFFVMNIDDSAYCVLPGACRKYNGELLLPKWLEPHAPHIRRCGVIVNGASFYDTPPAPVRDVDLFGTKFQRYHFPHFMQDMFHVVTLFNVVFNPTGDHITESLCYEQIGEKCAEARPSGMDWSPSVAVEDRIMQMDDDSWVKSFLRLLPEGKSGGSKGPPPVYMHDMYGEGENSGPTCFRSIVEGQPIYKSLTVPKSLRGVGNVLFSPNNIVKRPRESCPLQIRILNRIQPNGYTSGRYFPDVEALEKAIRSEVDKRGLQVEIKVMTFNEASFEDQVKQMNEVDLLISVHGAELTNVVWMRPQARVVEIMPFLYETEIFPEMGVFVDVGVEQIIAKPDPERFEQCLRVYNEKHDMQGTLQVVKAFKDLGDAFLASGKVGTFNQKDFDSKMIAPCLRAQRLIVDNDYVAKRSISRLDFRCTL